MQCQVIVEDHEVFSRDVSLHSQSNDKKTRVILENIRELKQRQRQRLRERHFKIEIRVAVITSRLFLLF